MWPGWFLEIDNDFLIYNAWKVHESNIVQMRADMYNVNAIKLKHS